MNEILVKAKITAKRRITFKQMVEMSQVFSKDLLQETIKSGLCDQMLGEIDAKADMISTRDDEEGTFDYSIDLYVFTKEELRQFIKSISGNEEI